MVLGAVLAAIIVGGLIGTIIAFVILKISDIVKRFKEIQECKTKAKKEIEVILGDREFVSSITDIPMSQLESMMGTQGLFEVPVIDDKVDVDRIAILKTDKQEPQLNSVMKDNGGVIKMTAKVAV